MYRPIKSVSVGSMLCFFIMWPFLISGTHRPLNATEEIAPSTTTSNPAAVITVAKSATEILLEEADNVYDSIHLNRVGLNRKAFEYAWKGYKYLSEKGRLANDAILSICDFSQSSRRKRLYIIDIAEMKVLMNTFVAHGRNSGGEYASSFSNNPDSHKSSLGFYVTGKTYYGDHGLALKIEGQEYGINDKADRRNIVIHGSEYVGSSYLRNNRTNGRSYGCPAVPEKDTKKVIETIKRGSCLFIYHPTKKYLTLSKILNG